MPCRPNPPCSISGLFDNICILNMLDSIQLHYTTISHCSPENSRELYQCSWYTLCLKTAPPKQVGITSSKQARHEWFFAEYLRSDCVWKAWYGLSVTCTVSISTAIRYRSVYTRNQCVTWLNWRIEWLRSGLTSNWLSLTGPLTSGENDSRHVSKLGDSISNICYNLYFRLLFFVCIDWKFLMIEKPRRNDWCISILVLLWLMLCVQLSYNIVI